MILRSLIFLFLITTVTFGQTSFRVFGRVTDNLTGEPLPYATVSVAGKAIGTVTNSDGSFDLRIESVPESDTLLISMIGQEQFMHSSTENVSPKKRKKN